MVKYIVLASTLMASLSPMNIGYCNSIHELLWSETYNSSGSNSDEGHRVAIDENGNVVVVGHEDRLDLGQKYNWRILKYGAEGNLLWSTAYDSPSHSWDCATRVATDGNGNIVVVGYEDRSDLGQGYNWRIRKYGPEGNLLWSTPYNSPSNLRDTANGVTVDKSANIVVVGQEDRASAGQGNNWRIRKYDPAGNLLWSEDYNSPANGDDRPIGVATDENENIVIVGEEARPDLGQGYNWRILMYSAEGGLLWSTSYNSPANLNDYGRGAAIDKGGNIVAVGFEGRSDLGQGNNWRILKYDSERNILWSTSYNSPANLADEAYEVAIDGNGNIAVVGDEMRTDLLQSYNWRILKYSAEGDMLWSTSYNSSANSNDIARGIATDGSRYIAAVGSEYRSDLGQGYNWLTRKYACPVEPPPEIPIEIPVEIPEDPYKGILRVFPNPYGRSDAVRGTVKFEGLDLGSQVRIYTIRGLLVWEGTVQEPYILEWNGRNEAGKPVAPGTYLWIAESVTGKERGSLIVE